MIKSQDAVNWRGKMVWLFDVMDLTDLNLKLSRTILIFQKNVTNMLSIEVLSYGYIWVFFQNSLSVLHFICFLMFMP